MSTLVAMTYSLQTAPLSDIRSLARHIPSVSTADDNNVREKLIEWIKDNEDQTRMTPWGMDIRTQWSENRKWVNSWGPKTVDLNIVCGRWIRDIEVPAAKPGCLLGCTCHRRDPAAMVFSDGASSVVKPGVLTAFRHGEETSAEYDFAERVDRTELRDPRTTKCRITELPRELLDLILENLVPAGGQTYHMFPMRSDKRTVQIIQRLVAEPNPTSMPKFDGNGVPLKTAPNSYQAIRDANPSNPATGSVGNMSLAATCRYFQDIVYTRFYSNNAFVFHLAAATVSNTLRSSDFGKFRCWSRVTADKPRALGPLTARAAAYMKDVTLIASLPFSNGSQDVSELSRKVSEAAEHLAGSKLDYLSIHLDIAEPASGDKRRAVAALPVDVLEAEVDENGKLAVRIKEPEVTPVRESNKAQKSLSPLLLKGPRNVKELVLSGPMSENFVEALRSAMKGEAEADISNQAGSVECPGENGEARTSKRRKIV